MNFKSPKACCSRSSGVMAASLCFGLMTSTVLVLVLVPTFYLIYARIFGIRGAAEQVRL